MAHYMPSLFSYHRSLTKSVSITLENESILTHIFSLVIYFIAPLVMTIHAKYTSGYRATQANLLSVPVYTWGCILTCLIGFLGDRIGSRGYINL